MMSVRPLILPRSNPTNTNARKSTSISIFVTNSSTCGRDSVDFQTRIRDAIIKRQSLDFIMAGFNGITRAATSNRKQNPLLQDVAVGWLQKYRNEAAARVMSKITDEDGKVISDVIRVGKNGDYENLDALVMDATTNLIDEIYQDDPELVVITGRKLMADKYFPLVNKAQENSETLAADIIISQKRIGNLPAVRVPYFPANALMVTRLDNLSIYFMDDAHRRAIIEEPKKDRIENYESMNIDYVIEAYAAGCLIENINLGDFTAPAAPESGGISHDESRSASHDAGLGL